MAENLSKIEDVIEYADDLESRLKGRDDTFKEMEKIFMMEWEDKPTGKGALKFTVSPDPRNAALGAIRLMIATDPTFSIPYNKSDPEARKGSERLEKLAAAMWYASGKTMQIPAHYDVVTSGVVFGEAHIMIIDTGKALKQAAGASKGALKRLERAATRSPYQFRSINPMEGYPDFDDWGLSAFGRRREVYGSEILDTWGSSASKVLTEDNARYEKYIYRELWDPTIHAVWIEGKTKPIFIGNHDLPVMPIAAQIIDGSTIFSKEEYRRQPFLYTVWKSELWERQNLWMTVFYSLLFEIGNGPMWIYEGPEETSPDFSNDDMGGYVHIPKGSSFKPAVNSIFDPNMMQGKEVADQKIMESTMYRQALGEPVGGNASFAMTDLLHHAGRLPLVSQQRRGGWVIGQAMEIAFELMKDKKESSEILTKTEGIISMDPEEIPENLMVEGKLDIALPQDNQANAQIAIQLTNGDNPMTSQAWARENMLQIGQSSEMTTEIWDEKTANLKFMQEYHKHVMQLQQEMQAMQQQQMGQAPGQQSPGQPPQGQPQQQPMPQGQPPQPGQPGQPPGGELTPEMLMQMPPEQVRALLTQQGIPPEQQDQIMAQMQGGMPGGGGQVPGAGA